VLDLDYAEDSSAETDMNVVMNDAAAFIEVQRHGRGSCVQERRAGCDVGMASLGIKQLLEKQQELWKIIYNDFSSSQQIVLASGNQGKITEIQAILAGHPICSAVGI